MTGERTASFRNSASLDSIIRELKELLAPIQKMVDVSQSPSWPILAIIGNPRSGSSLLLQALAATGTFSYPTNLLTRFAYCPYVGARVQQMLFDKTNDPHGDFADIRSCVNFDSDLGRSHGALAANEFQHFFRCFIPTFDPRFLENEEIEQIDFAGIAQGLISIEAAFGKPFVTKTMLMQYNLAVFFQNLPQLLFLHIIRNPIYIMQSILQARERYYGSRRAWWSVKPKQYEFLKDMDVYHQIAGQVYFTEKAIEDGLTSVPAHNQLTIEYESFCENPKRVYDQIVKKCAALGCEVSSKYNGPESFACQNQQRLPKGDLKNLQKAFGTVKDMDTGV